MISRSLAVAGGLLALAVVGGAAQLTGPAPLAAASARAPRARVVGATLVCPDLHTVPGVQSSALAVADTDPAAGQVTVAALGSARGPAGGSPAGVLLAAGQRSATYHGPLSGAVVLRATGPLAGGLVAEQLSGAARTARRGWDDEACSAPRADQWFVGPGTVVGESPVLVLANPDSVPALVSVTVLTPTGPAADSQAQSIAVAAGTVSRVPLAQLAPNAIATAVQVTTVTGRVAAAVHDVRANGLVPLGTDWVPAQAGPARRLDLAGLPDQIAGQPATRTLLVGDPGSQPAMVTVRVLTPQGRFVPTGLAGVPVAPGTVRTFPLSAALGAFPGAIAVTSSAPVVAGALLDARSLAGPDHDIAYLGAARALTGPAAIAQSRIGTTVNSVLELSAPAAAGQVRVIAQAAAGGRLSLPVLVPAGRTVEVSLRHAGAAAGLVIVVPEAGSGPVIASRWIEQDGPGGPLVTALGLVSAAPLVPVPAVAAAPLSLP